MAAFWSKSCSVSLLSLSLVACGGGGAAASGEQAQQQPTLSLEQQRDKLEGAWTQQCSSPIEHQVGQFGPQSSLNKLTFAGPDASGLIRVIYKTEFHESTLNCYTQVATPYATVTWGEIEMRFDFIGYLAGSGQGPVDVYAVSQPSRTVVVEGSQGVVQLGDGSWTITFQDGKSIDIPALSDTLPSQLPIHVRNVNSTPYVDMTFNGYGLGGDADLLFKRDDRSY